MKVKMHLPKYATTKHPLSTLSENLKWSQMRGIVYTSDLCNFQTEKKLKKYIIARTGFLRNESNARFQI